jgi:O-antigen/teichoic acid export membrane protein
LDRHKGVHFGPSLTPFRHLYSVLVPAVCLTALGGWPVLRLYGSHYAQYGYLPLLILAASSLVVAVNWLGDAWLNVQKRGFAYLCMNALNAAAVVGSVYAFSDSGLSMAAIGWLVGQGASAVVYVAIFGRSQLGALLALPKTRR